MHMLSPGVHRALDFVTVAGFALAPTVFGLTGVAAIVAYLLAGIHLLLTLVTRRPASSSGLVPLRLHGIIELGVGIALLALPIAAGWVGVARTFYLAAGAVILLVWLLSAYEHTPA